MGGFSAAIYLASDKNKKTKRAKSATQNFSISESAPTLLTLLIPIYVLFNRFSKEFPFIGDHDYHLFSALQAFYFIQAALIPLILASLGTVFVLRRLQKVPHGEIWTCLYLAGLWFCLSLWADPEGAFYIRYPGAFYFVAYPFVLLSQTASDWTVYHALQFANFVSIPLWLFVLRPRLLKKPIDTFALLVCVAVFWQKDFLYYFTTAYLEPWSLILLLLAIESLFIDTVVNYPRAIALIGIATLFKETTILAFPFFFAARFWVTQARLSKHDLAWTLASFTAALTYFLVRSQMGVSRKFELIRPLSDFLSLQRLTELRFRLDTAFGWNSLWVLLIFIVAATLTFASAKSRERRNLFLLLSSAAGILVFYLLDKASVEWTGYSRFYLICWVLVVVPILWIYVQRNQGKKKLSLAALLLFFAIFNLVPTLRSFAPTFGGAQTAHDYNFYEHYESPIYYSLSAVPKATAEIQHLKIMHPSGIFVPNYSMNGVEVAQASLKNYQNIQMLDVQNWSCDCKTGELGVLLTVRGANLMPPSHPKFAQLEALQSQCLDQIKTKSCSITTLSEEGGWLIKAL